MQSDERHANADESSCDSLSQGLGEYHCTDKIRTVLSGPHCAIPCFELKQRKECHWTGIVARLSVFRILNHPDNFNVVSRRFVTDAEVFADRISARKIVTDKYFVDH